MIFIALVVVDTVNGFYQDTTTYSWTIPLTLHGDSIWIRVREGERDTALYVFNQGIVKSRSSLGPTVICVMDAGGNLIERLWDIDLSCGFTSNPWQSRTNYITADGYWRSNEQQSCGDTNCEADGDRFRLPRVFLVDGLDTTAMYMSEFYGSVATTATYKLREYFINGDSLYMNDLRNSIDSIFVANLTPILNAGWTSVSTRMQVYNVRWDSLSNKVLPIDTTFENLNSASFTPLLILNSTLFPYTTAVMELLDYPPDATTPLAEDTELSFTCIISQRNLFRGIHPKAEKRQ
jgi:hypothetical protein